VAHKCGLVARRFYAQLGSQVAKRIPEDDLTAIEHAVRRHAEGASGQQIQRELKNPLPLRTLQYRLKYLTTHHRIVKDGQGRWAKYRLPPADDTNRATAVAGQPVQEEPVVPLSQPSAVIRKYVRKSPEARKPAGYNREFLDSYRPNVTSYLSAEERAHLASVGRPQIGEQPAGTYAKQILSRLLIDLAWNSSRLEGNTYSLLDTKRLIELGEEAEGREHLEAQMILNHKDAIEFLVSTADEIGFNRYTILNLHAMLANNLLPDPTAAGRLRHIAVGIERSASIPWRCHNSSQSASTRFSRPRRRSTIRSSRHSSSWCSFPICSHSTT
jgi:hypothetical protein